MESSEEDLPMSPGGYIAAATVLSLIGFFGFSLNLIVIILFIREKQLRTPMNMVLLNLAISDMCVASFGNPLTLTAAVLRRWPFGPKLCIAYAFFMSFFGMASIGALSLLALERCLLVAQPLRRSAPTLRCALLSLVGVWAYALALSAPPLAGWGAFGPEAANISCSVNWEKPDMNSTSYIAFLFILGLLLPVCIIGGSYVTIVRTMRRSSLRAGRALPRAERRLTILVLVMSTAFLVAWAPYAALALASAAARGPVASPAVAVLPALLAKSSVCYNPIIYVGLNSQFRAAWQRLLGVRPTARGSSQTAGGELTSFVSPTRIVSRAVSTAAEHTLAPPLVEAINGSRKSPSPPRPPVLTPLPPPPAPTPQTVPFPDDGKSPSSQSVSAMSSPPEIASPTLPNHSEMNPALPDHDNIGMRPENSLRHSEKRGSTSDTKSGYMAIPSEGEALTQDSEINSEFPEHSEGNCAMTSVSVPPETQLSPHQTVGTNSRFMSKPSESESSMLPLHSETNATFPVHDETNCDLRSAKSPVPPENRTLTSDPPSCTPSLLRSSEIEYSTLPQASEVKSARQICNDESRSPQLDTNPRIRSEKFPELPENSSCTPYVPTSGRSSSLRRPSERESATSLESAEIQSPTLSEHFIKRSLTISPDTIPSQSSFGAISPSFSHRLISNTHPSRPILPSQPKQKLIDVPNNCVQDADTASKNVSPIHENKDMSTS